ncbi:DUF3558 domain-containing protein [Nocardia sp. NBC_01329]|uniref:DUF3558 domain-containing protein n=1 Tax=Nocardia sp. NBC_01329 TaxID=2903594 RepID=UPI002E115E01|nr:DUF3558 domain-containing protein [Nocardia sp. NBC_01329]
MGRIWLPLLACAGLLVAGCGETTVEGSPTTTERPTTVAFNPCSDLPDDALRAAGLDPATKKTSVDTPTGGGTWKICFWRPVDKTPYAVSIGTTTFTQDDLPGNPTITGLSDVQIGSRAGKTYRQANSPLMLRCYVSMPSGGGMANVIVDWDASERETAPEKPPCSLAVEQATELEPFLPN